MTVSEPLKRLDLRKPAHLFAFGFGSGLASPAPGTWGTIAALLPWWGLQYLPLPLYALLVAVAAVAGISLCARTAIDLGVHDHGGIVWDEFVGLWIALALTPLHPFWILTGFLFFRLFDIFKPWPISWLDRHMTGGLGIMVDDVAAGVAALGAQALLMAAVL
jgi:phosphatidylglycerophosphatase A